MQWNLLQIDAGILDSADRAARFNSVIELGRVGHLRIRSIRVYIEAEN